MLANLLSLNFLIFFSHIWFFVNSFYVKKSKHRKSHKYTRYKRIASVILVLMIRSYEHTLKEETFVFFVLFGSSLSFFSSTIICRFLVLILSQSFRSTCKGEISVATDSVIIFSAYVMIRCACICIGDALNSHYYFPLSFSPFKFIEHKNGQTIVRSPFVHTYRCEMQRFSIFYASALSNCTYIGNCTKFCQ